ncbi:hypothetical protein LCGC14_2760980 [marine sediment metagenome]|uniref:Uncharacterized protein n=1 Tax=marine sediment metagenome TaxID=412755 RepID=A0A0F9B7K0_9ZZZZ
MALILAMEMTGEPLTTLKHTCGDTVQTLVADVTGFLAQVTKTRGTPQLVNVIACLITVETYSIRFAWGTAATQAGLGHVLSPGQSLKLTNHKQIIDFRFINQTNSENAVLQITPELAIP